MRTRLMTTATIATAVGLVGLVGAKELLGQSSQPTPIALPIGVATLEAAPSASPTAAATSGSATYTGEATATRYGDIQVQITVEGGKVTDVVAVAYPNQDRHDQQINATAIPQLRSEALDTQSARISSVSGATYTSAGYITSLQSALDQAGLS